MMQFQVGDYVLWWGRIMRVKKTGSRGGLLTIARKETEQLVFRDSLAHHQKPWEYDRDNKCWVLASNMQAIRKYLQETA